MFKRLVTWLKRRKDDEPEMITVYGIQSAPWGQDTPGFPKGVPVALRTIRRDSVPIAQDISSCPQPPRPLKRLGTDQSPEAIKARHRAWLVSTLPDEAMFR